MKKAIGVLLIIFMISCQENVKRPSTVIQSRKDPSSEVEKIVNEKNSSDKESTIKGIWKRELEMLPGKTAKVSYHIENEKVTYSLDGPFAHVTYSIEKDTLLLEQNRFIGHTPTGKYYVLEFKVQSSSSISIIKQEVNDLKSGLDLVISDKVANSQFGWNLYTK